MYLSRIAITNFRQFGPDSVTVDFEQGVTVLAGPNDSGKTAILDAIRYLLTTRDQEYIGIRPDDYHISDTGVQTDEFQISGRFRNLSDSERARFVEHLTYTADGYYLDLQLIVKRKVRGVRVSNYSVITSGPDGQGAVVDSSTRDLLACTYLRPLRDAERELAPGQNSRLSKVLKSYVEIDSGRSFDKSAGFPSGEELTKLSLTGQSELFEHLVNSNSGVTSAKNTLNEKYLEKITLKNDGLAGTIGLVSGETDEKKLRQILERLQLNLIGETESDGTQVNRKGRYGLGSNNLLYIACELLLISQDKEGMKMLLVEEPEAHVHPQRQLQTFAFLKDQAELEGMQIIVSTHSPVLASKAKAENVVLVTRNGPFSLAKENTKLSRSDYGYLNRFLDATKANLFFAEHLLIVEGDAEELLLPTVARLLGMDLTKAGVSVVNVRGVGLRRYARIFIRGNELDRNIPIRVACITDRDIVPEVAVDIMKYKLSEKELKYQNSNDPVDIPTALRRKWRSEEDSAFGLVVKDGIYGNTDDIESGKKEWIEKKKSYDEASVKTFISDQWTLEYDLALSGLAYQVFIAASLALKDEDLHAATDFVATRNREIEKAKNEFLRIESGDSDPKVIAAQVYKKFEKGGASKAIAAQHLSQLLEDEFSGRPDVLRNSLPQYILDALDHVIEDEKVG